MTLSRWISSKPPRGQYTFSRQDILTAFPDIKPGYLKTAIAREIKKKRIISPCRNFYVIIPEEYALRKVVPQTFYIDQMMHFLGRKYYIALLNAADHYGASHQAPQTMTLMIEPPRLRDKDADGTITRFVLKKSLQMEYIQQHPTRSGHINISSPELTSVDLITYQTHVGGLNRAATVLGELADELNFERLPADFYALSPTVSFQRLGYILEHVLERTELADSLYISVKSAELSFQKAALKAGKGTNGATEDKRWKILVNQKIEIDDL